MGAENGERRVYNQIGTTNMKEFWFGRTPNEPNLDTKPMGKSSLNFWWETDKPKSRNVNETVKN